MRSIASSFGVRASIATLIALCYLACSCQAASSAKLSSQKVLVASDIHFNPMADASLVPQLVAANPSQWETILNRTSPRKFSPYGQDTNLSLIHI